MEQRTAQLEADLKRQHLEFLRSTYDGHNRRSGIVDAADLRKRARRRAGHRFLGVVARSWVISPMPYQAKRFR